MTQQFLNHPRRYAVVAHDGGVSRSEVMTTDCPLQTSLATQRGDALTSGPVLVVNELSVRTTHRMDERGTDRVPCAGTDRDEALLVPLAAHAKDHGLSVEPCEVKVKGLLNSKANESDTANQCVLLVVSSMLEQTFESFQTLGQGVRDRATRCWSLVLTQLRLDVRPPREPSEAGQPSASCLGSCRCSRLVQPCLGQLLVVLREDHLRLVELQ